MKLEHFFFSIHQTCNIQTYIFLQINTLFFLQNTEHHTTNYEGEVNRLVLQMSEGIILPLGPLSTLTSKKVSQVSWYSSLSSRVSLLTRTAGLQEFLFGRIVHYWQLFCSSGVRWSIRRVLRLSWANRCVDEMPSITAKNSAGGLHQVGPQCVGSFQHCPSFLGV